MRPGRTSNAVDLMLEPNQLSAERQSDVTAANDQHPHVGMLFGPSTFVATFVAANCSVEPQKIQHSAVSPLTPPAKVEVNIIVFIIERLPALAVMLDSDLA